MPEPYWSQDGLTLYLGDCRHVMAALPAESVSACVTSPPFWGLRKYECEPTVWGGAPQCLHEWGAQSIKGEGYTGASRWQHSDHPGRTDEGINRTARPDAWTTDFRETATCSLCGAWRGWYGLEPSVSMYVEHTLEVLRATRRVLLKDGTVWWDIDDSRGSDSRGVGRSDGRGALSYQNANLVRGRAPVSPKSLSLIPQRIAIAAQEDGWIVRSQIIIPAWMPESARDRPTDAYRVVLMLTKSKHYWYDGFAVRVNCDGRDQAHGEDAHQAYTQARGNTGPLTGGRTYERHQAADGLRNLGNIWDIPPAAHPSSPSFRHFAVMPLAEAERCILASVPEAICTRCDEPRVRMLRTKAMVIDRSDGALASGVRTLPSGTMREAPEAQTVGWSDCGCGEPFEPGIVLDPFSGTGTTLLAAQKLGRRAIGIELSQDYCRQAVTRLTVGDKGIRTLAAAENGGVEQGALNL